jgi:hypothetical protein
MVAKAEVRPYRGKPTIFVDDEPMAPFFYALTHAYGGRWSWEEVPARNIRQYGELGVRLFQVDLYFEDIYAEGTDSLDIETARRQVRGVTDACPGARVVVRVHVNAPFWWNDAHPEECTEYADTPVEDRSYGPPLNNEDGDPGNCYRTSLASKRWRAEATARLQELCERLATAPEGADVIGIHVCWGVYGEWHYWGFIQHDPDTGPAMTKHFRRWLRQQYATDDALQRAWGTRDFTLQDATVPGVTERANDHPPFLRDPAGEQRTIDYYRCQHELVADDLLHFCRTVKESWPRPLLVGVFYGYFHHVFCRQATGGHLGIERVLNSPWVDYLSSPQAHCDQGEGPPVGLQRGLVESVAAHGKLWLDEFDKGALQEGYTVNVTRTEIESDPQYLPLLRRGAVSPLARGAGLWYYDFGVRTGRGWWDHPDYLDCIAADRRFAEKNLHRELDPPADVLLVFDAESFYYTRDRWHQLKMRLADGVACDVRRSGAISDSVYLFDLPQMDLDRYKAIMFVTTFCMDEEQRAFIRNEVAAGGRTLIWQYMPGITDGRRLDPALTTELTGIQLHRIESGPEPVLDMDLPGGLTASIEYWEAVDPLYAVQGDVEVLGRLRDSGEAIVGRRELRDHVSVHAVLPLLGPSALRAVFRQAGAHIYNDADDVVHGGCGTVWVRTLECGPRSLHLRNGKVLELDMPPHTTSVFDAQTGQRLL